MAHAITYTGYAGGTREQGIFARLFRAAADYRAYLGIRADLEKLSDRMLDDMGLNRFDIPAVAREAAFGS